MNLENKEIESRGKILALSLKIEDCLNRIIYNFFIPESEDKKTRNIYLQSFIIPQSFAQKVNIYKEILKTERYSKKVIKKLKTNAEVLYIDDFESFEKIVKQNLAEIISTRNYVAHGIDISNAFLTLEQDEVVLMNKLNLLKISNETINNFSTLVKKTYSLMNLTNGSLKEK